MKSFHLFLAASLLCVSVPSYAASRTVTLSVPGMSCPVCPITVRKALHKVNGVQEVHVDFDSKQAVVSFDDAKTSKQALQQATGNAGYPASVIK